MENPEEHKHSTHVKKTKTTDDLSIRVPDFDHEAATNGGSVTERNKVERPRLKVVRSSIRMSLKDLKTSLSAGAIHHSKALNEERDWHVSSSRLSIKPSDMTTLMLNMPPKDELNKQFETLLESIGHNEETKKKMRELTAQNKWQLIIQKSQEASKPSPEEYISSIKSNPKLETIEHLVISLKGESVDWVNQFIRSGGVKLLVNLLRDNIRKIKQNRLSFGTIRRNVPFATVHETDLSKGKQKASQKITHLVIAIKGIMQSEEGLEAIKEIDKTLPLLIKSMNHVSERSKIVILQILSAISFLDLDIHRELIPLVSHYYERFIEMAYNFKSMELVTTTFMYFNCLLNMEGHDIPERADLRERLLSKGLAKIIQSLRKKPDLPANLETQLNIFEDHIHVDISHYIKKGSDNPEIIFQKLLKQIKGTSSYDTFPIFLEHLLLMRVHGDAGLISWELLDKFAQGIASLNRNSANGTISAFETTVRWVRTKLETNKSETDTDTTSTVDEKVPPSLAKLFAPVSTASSTKGSNDSTTEEAKSTGNIPSAPSIPNPPTGTGGGPPPPPPPPGVSGGPPPPPPPGVSGGPPPPPPPGGRGPPPPPGPGGRGPGGPPPPGAIQSKYPPKPVIKPNKKMRHFNWTTIHVRKLDGTVWENIDESKVEVPVNELESFFSEDAIPKKELTVSRQESKKPTTIIVLDPKKWQNLSIMLSRFSDTPYKKIADSILSLDEKLIGLDELQSLCQFIPSPDDVEALKPYIQTPPPNLGNPEKYYLSLLNIEHLDLRLESWLYIRTFQSKYDECVQNISTIFQAAKEVKNSSKWKNLLKVILAFGNYLNGGTTRGQAWGFKLESVQKMLDLRSTSDPKMTFLHYLHEHVSKKFPELTNIIEELPHLSPSQRMSLNALMGDIEELKNGMSKVEECVKALSEGSSKSYSIYNSFLKEKKPELEQLNKKSQETQNLFKETVTFYGEDAKTMDCEDFFGLVYKFLMSFDKAGKDIQRWNAAIEKEKERLLKLKNEKNDKEKEPNPRTPTKTEGQETNGSTPSPSKKPASPTEQPKGVLDRVLADLTSGQAYIHAHEEHKKKRKSKRKHKFPTVKKKKSSKSPKKELYPLPEKE